MTDPVDWTAVARIKITTIMGREQGEQLLQDVLREIRLEMLRSADDLYVFSQSLMLRGGFAGATGSLLGVYAVMRGARGS